MVTAFEEVYSEFLSQISTYEYLDYQEAELNEEFLVFLKRAMAKFVEKDFTLNETTQVFSRELKDLEITILGLGMLEAWISPKINNLTLLKQSLSSKDYTFYSSANHLKELMSLRKGVNDDFNYYIQRLQLHKLSTEGDN